jgi:hypothetical protein
MNRPVSESSLGCSRLLMKWHAAMANYLLMISGSPKQVFPVYSCDVRNGALGSRSATHSLIAITHMWHQALDERNSIRALFVDFAGAFDHVDYLTVLANITALNIHSCLIRWVHSYFVKSSTMYKDCIYVFSTDDPHWRNAARNMVRPICLPYTD